MNLSLFYNTNPSFLYPTIQSIRSLMEFIPASDIKLYVALMNDGDFDLSSLDRISEILGINFISVENSIIDSQFTTEWNGDRIPPVTLLKLKIFDILPEKVDRVLYIDPDTLFVRNPKKLFEFQLRSGNIGVVEDALSFYFGDWSSNGKTARAYVKSLELSIADGYFNAGLLLFDRRTWVEIAAQALSYLSSNMRKCIYQDQSALNAVASRRKVSLSPIWNYQTRFRFWGDHPLLKPNILHFTGAHKPWLAPTEPWRDVYDRVLMMESEIKGFGLKRPYANSEDVERHNAGFDGILNAARRKIDYRLVKRRNKLVLLHNDAAC